MSKTQHLEDRITQLNLEKKTIQDRLNWAEDRIYDMLLGDDSQAWKEAQRYLKLHRRDLYDRIEVGIMKKGN